MEHQPIVIQPPSRLSLGLRELWHYRELFYFFTWRDIKVKYRQTILGVLWVLLQPVALMLLLSLVSGHLKPQTGTVPYALYVFSGLILWNLFYGSVAGASDSMIQQAHIIRKVYFPRLIIPCSSLLTASFDFCFAFLLFLVLCLIWQQPLSLAALYCFPAAILLALLAAFGLGTLLAALNVHYRDFRYLLPFLLQLLFFSSQVIYALNDVLHPVAANLLALNPMNGILEIFRYPMTGVLHGQTVLISVASTLVCCGTGLFYFRKTEAFFADLA